MKNNSCSVTFSEGQSLLGGTPVEKDIEFNYGSMVVESASVNYSESFDGKRSKLDEVRSDYMKKISMQPEGYREQLVSDLVGRHKIHPTLQEELVSEWDLEDARDT